MNKKVKESLDYLNKRDYRSLRCQDVIDITEDMKNVPLMEVSARRFEKALDSEKPVFYMNDIFGFNRYMKNNIKCQELFDECWGGSAGEFGNNTIDYAKVLNGGLNSIMDKINQNYNKVDKEGREFYDAFKICYNACERLVKRYQQSAKELGKTELYEALKVVPFNGAQNYYQALVTMSFMKYTLRLNCSQHVTIGRFDQYMKPFYDISKKNGATYDELLELTELFFISLNYDTDLYRGIQQGDNGQSLVLGGLDVNGNETFNELSDICLDASEELCLIDPKINIRVNKNTPLSLYERGTRLTKQCLGFPQYSNDDVVIPGLVSLGYDFKDACEYTVAACWEFIIPGYGADIPNIVVMNFPMAVSNATEKYLENCATFDDFKQKVKEEIERLAQIEMDYANKTTSKPEAYMSAFLNPCIETGKDISRYGAKYNNYGMHGAGISTCADALASIKEVVFDKKEMTAKHLNEVLKANFVGFEEEQRRLNACPKMGNNDDYVDDLASFIMDVFTSYVNNKPNNRGGIFRAGTGSAMEYVWSANKVGATADGRVAKGNYGSSFSPSLTANLNGPLSAVLSFSKYDMKNICNGGPFTIEIHDTVFRNDEGDKKVAMLIKAFIDNGGHQMQINAINRDKLLDAQKHPEKYPNLIVRVWGWSGYFNELDIEFQNHIIKRCEFTFN